MDDTKLDLSRKYGPLPAWAWVGVTAAALIAFYWLRHRHTAASATASDTSSGTVAVPTYATTGDLAAAGLYAPPPIDVVEGNIAGPAGPQGMTGPAGPAGAPGAAAPAPVTAPVAAAAPAPAPAPRPAPPPVAAIAPTVPSASQGRYIIVQPWPRKDSSLWSIAQDADVSLATVEALNPQIRNPNLVYAGEPVRVA